MNPVVKLIWTDSSRGQECDCGQIANRNRPVKASEHLTHFGKVVVILLSLEYHKKKWEFNDKTVNVEGPPTATCFVVHLAFKLINQRVRKHRLPKKELHFSFCPQPCQLFFGCLDYHPS